MTKCGNFFRPKETKGREDSIWFHTSESSLRSLRLLAKAFGVTFCYKDCFGEPHLRLRSAMARRLDDCRGSRVGCFREIASGTPATTVLLWREETTYTRRKDLKLSSSSIFLQRCLRRPGERFDAGLCFSVRRPAVTRDRRARRNKQIQLVATEW